MTPNTTVGGLKPEELRAAVRIWKAIGDGMQYIINGRRMDKNDAGEYFVCSINDEILLRSTDPNDALDALGID